MARELLFEQFADQLRNEIHAEKYSPGAVLPSISKLQEMSGLSRNTIVAALRILMNEGTISRAGATRYGYRVSDGALRYTGNARQGTSAIALVFPFSYHNYIGNQLLRAMEATLSKKGHSLVIRNHENSWEQEAEILNNILGQDRSDLDGIVLMTSDSYANPNRETIRRIGNRIPLVLLDRYLFGLPSLYVGLNNRQVGRDAANYLIDRGHQRLGFISGFEKLSPMMDRWAGYREAAERRSIAVLPENVYITPDEFRIVGDDHRDIDKLRCHLDLSASGPTAFFCGDDKSAMTLHRALVETSRRVPEDVSIIGCDDDGFVQATSRFGISSFRHPFSMLAEQVIRLLEEKKANPGMPSYCVEVAADFIDRSSVSTVEVT